MARCKTSASADAITGSIIDTIAIVSSVVHGAIVGTMTGVDGYLCVSEKTPRDAAGAIWDTARAAGCGKGNRIVPCSATVRCAQSCGVASE